MWWQQQGDGQGPQGQNPQRPLPNTYTHIPAYPIPTPSSTSTVSSSTPSPVPIPVSLDGPDYRHTRRHSPITFGSRSAASGNFVDLAERSSSSRSRSGSRGNAYPYHSGPYYPNYSVDVAVAGFPSPAGRMEDERERERDRVSPPGSTTSTSVSSNSTSHPPTPYYTYQGFPATSSSVHAHPSYVPPGQ